MQKQKSINTSVLFSAPVLCTGEECVSFECEKKDILQPRLQTPTERPGRRAIFMTLYRWLPFPAILWLFRKHL